MKYLCIIQARCGSTRLPNKVLRKLNSKPMILHVIQRVKRSKYVDDIVLATSIEKENLPLLKVCVDNNVRIFVGSENDVLDRYYQAAKLLKPEYVIRVTADCPLYDFKILDDAIEQMSVQDDYLGDINEELADGLDIEIFKFSALETSWKNAKLLSEREHVTLFIKNNPHLFRIRALKSKILNISKLRLTVDEMDDFKLVEKIYEHFGDNELFDTNDVVQFLTSHPELLKLNCSINRNEGLKTSILKDQELSLER